MTAQVPESLDFDGEKLAMTATPLGLVAGKLHKKIKLSQTCTALWRGYVGSWELTDKKLYLTHISADLVEENRRVRLDDFFPGYPDRVFAHWVNQTLSVPRGKELKYVHMGFGSIYEYTLYLKIRRGHLVETWVEDNRDKAKNMKEAFDGPII
jgi:hypothetical protein